MLVYLMNYSKWMFARFVSGADFINKGFALFMLGADEVFSKSTIVGYIDGAVSTKHALKFYFL
ncbi:hypothetical protein JGL56_06070 [Salmonella enterica subsp. enterica serovar Derby]|nr:hypothetical protein [Salmonella enterica subsp. enterica serovar Derby]